MSKFMDCNKKDILGSVKGQIRTPDKFPTLLRSTSINYLHFTEYFHNETL